MKTLLVFSANLVNDVLAVSFIRCVENGYAYLAGLVSVAILILYALTLCLVVKSPWYLLPAGVGAFLGTVMMVGIR